MYSCKKEVPGAAGQVGRHEASCSLPVPLQAPAGEGRVGVAGGKRDATKIQTGDLGEAFSDELLRQVRKKLRRDYGFTHGTTKKIAKLDVRCVWSTEPPIYPWADGTCAAVPEPGSNLMMDCETGFGSAVFVTGAFGLIAAGEVVKDITQSR